MPIPESHLDILTTKKAFAHFVTLMPDGTPQSSPVWVDHADGKVLINTALGRRKDENVQADPRVAISVTDPDNPYRALMIRGRVTERTTDGAEEHIDQLAKRYLGKDTYPYRQPGEQRVLYEIEPDKVSTVG